MQGTLLDAVAEKSLPRPDQNLPAGLMGGDKIHMQRAPAGLCSRS